MHSSEQGNQTAFVLLSLKEKKKKDTLFEYPFEVSNFEAQDLWVSERKGLLL